MATSYGPLCPYRAPYKELQMIMRKTVFVSILFASITCSGCFFTTEWNNKMEAKMNALLSTKTFSHGPDSFGIDIAYDHDGYHPEYKRCDYIGTAAIEGFHYHQYLCPNMYNDSKHAFLELLIPFVEGEKEAAIVKSVHRRDGEAKRTNVDRPVYIGFNHELRPDGIRRVDRSLHDTPFFTSFPSLISMNLNQLTGKASLRFMQKKAKGLYTSNELIQLSSKRDDHYRSACPETFDMPIYDYYKKSGRDECELWYWSDEMIVSGAIETTNKTPLKVKRAMGYMITVPADIVTSPIQLIGLIVAPLLYVH